MPLIRIACPFDDPAWLFEIKHDGFRAVAVVPDRRCTLVLRNGNTFTRFPELTRVLPTELRATDAVLDGEIVCLDATAVATSPH